MFGVFDLLHPGHLSFLQQAKRLGDFLIVSVARDVNVNKIKSRKPAQNEQQRLKHVSRLAFVDKAVLGGRVNPWPHIKKEKPDIIALGYDQKSYVAINQLQKIARVVRLKAYKPRTYKSSYLRNK